MKQQAFFAGLDDFILGPPAPAAISVLMAVGLLYLGWRLALRLRNGDVAPVDVAGGFVLAAAGIAALVQVLAFLQIGYAPLRILGWLVASLGGYAIGRHYRRVAAGVVDEVTTLWGASPLDRAGTILVALTVLGLFASALGPVTDADSIDYHLGVPLDWLRHGGTYPRPDWFTSRLVGAGECLNMLGLAAGTDGLGAALQFGGAIAAAVALREFAVSSRDRLLAWLFVFACPVLAFLVPNQKAQMLPIAATTIALVLAVRRTSTFGLADAIVAASCLAFAAAAKVSFLLSVGFVAGVCLLSAARSGRFKSTLAVGVAAFGIFLVPWLWQKFLFFGDPLSPFLERLRSSPDVTVIGFATKLQTTAREHTLGDVLDLVRESLFTTHLGGLSTTLGLGMLGFVAALRAKVVSRPLLLAAGGCVVVSLAFGALEPRFLMEPYLWVGGASIAASRTAWKSVLAGGLTLQASLTAGMALYGAATLFPGALTWTQRDVVMSRAAAGYLEGKWLDRVLPPDAVVIGYGRFHAFKPRPFVDSEQLHYHPNPDARLAELVSTQGVNTIVWGVGSENDPLFRLGHACGQAPHEQERFPLSTRNPFNRNVQYEIRVFRLQPCDRTRQFLPR